MLLCMCVPSLLENAIPGMCSSSSHRPALEATVSQTSSPWLVGFHIETFPCASPPPPMTNDTMASVCGLNVWHNLKPFLFVLSVIDEYRVKQCHNSTNNS